MDISCDGPVEKLDERGETVRKWVGTLLVERTVKDPVSGRLLVDELREAVKSRRKYRIHYHKDDKSGDTIRMVIQSGSGVLLREPKVVD